MEDIGFTHIALPVSEVEGSLRFYEKYAKMSVVHRRRSENTGRQTAWVSDKIRSFVIVLMEVPQVTYPLLPVAHLGVACKSKQEVDSLCEEAKREGVLLEGPEQEEPPVGYWAFLRDPDGHTLELSFGQEVDSVVQGAT